MSKKRERKYRIIVITILLVIVGIVANYQLRKLGNRISGEYLQELVTNESKGLYRLEFEELDLNIFRKSVNIRKLELYATPENREDSINAKNIYEAKVGEVNISLESVIRIYTEKELVVDGIEVVNPLVFMTKINPDKESIKFGRETGKLYEVISQYLDLLQINYFKVRSGTVDHSPSNFRLKAIDFDVKSFTVSQDRKKKKIFYSEAINLGVNEQSILLPDSIHKLSFEGFELSTKDSILNFNNLKITARKDIDPTQAFEEDNQNIYNIDIPTLELKGINYLKAYEDNFLLVNQVNIPKPIIKIQSVLTSDKVNDGKAENRIGASLLALFDLIKIKNLNIEKGGLNLTLKGDNQQRFLSDNISIDLFNISLDSSQRDLQNVIHYFEDATVEINDYDYLLPDNLHNIKFKKLSFNTVDSTLKVEKLKIKPSRRLEDSTLTQFNLNLPLLEIEGMAHLDIYDNNRVNLDKLILRNAAITVTPPYLQESDRRAVDLTASKLHQMLSKYLGEIKVEEFSVLNSDLSVGEVFTGKSLNIFSYYFRIDSTLESWHQVSDSIIINGQELDFNSEKGQFKVSTFQLEDKLHSLDLTDLKITYEDLRDQIKVDYVSFKGVQLDSILNRKKLSIDSITLLRPKVAVNYQDLRAKGNRNESWEFPEKPINILLTKGSLNYQIDPNRNLKIAALDIELNYQKEIKLFQIRANQLELRDEKIKHKVSISQLSLPKNSSNLSLQNIFIQPFGKNDSLSLTTKIPKVSFVNFDKSALIKKSNFRADSLFATINQISFKGFYPLKNYSNFSTGGDNQFSATIQNTSITLDSASFILLNDKKPPSRINSSHSKLLLYNLNLPKKKGQNILYSDKAIFSNKDFSFYSPENDSLKLENISYNSTSKIGEIQSLAFKGSDNTTSLKIEGIKLSNAKISDFVESKSVKLKELSSSKTTLNFTIKKKEGGKIPNSIQLPFKKLNIDKLLAKEIDIKIYHQERERNFYVRKADLLVKQLSLDSAFNPKQIHQHLSALEFSGKNYKENFGEHYTVFASDYTFRYPESSFVANDIKMRSKYGRFEYSDQIEYQNDWFKLDLTSLKLSQLNIDSLLLKERFILNKLSLDQGEFTVFRDLNVPHNENRKVPMPQQVLSKLNFAFKVDTVFVNSDILIYIVPKESSGIGALTLNIDEGYLFNLRTHHFKNTNPMLLQAQGRLNEVGKFNTKVIFPMRSKKGDFQFLGSIGEMDLRELNDMLVPLGAIEVRSGFAETVQINFKGNTDYAEGSMEFRYNKLKIDMLDRKTYQSRGFGNNLKTIFANSFVVSTKNPRWFRVQQGNIFFERIKSRSIFNLWAKSLLSGAVSSIGINKSKEEAKAYYKENKEQIED